MYNYCTICGKKIKNYLDKISVCHDNNCEYEYECLLTDNTIINSYKELPDTTELLFLTMLSALNHKKREFVFTPFPYYFSTDKKNIIEKF